MAQLGSQQIPQHITALLSHLTSRPGVQSTFILSRKDGSIIQSTGLYASEPTTDDRAVKAPASTTQNSESESEAGSRSVEDTHAHAHTQSSTTDTTTTTTTTATTSTSQESSSSSAAAPSTPPTTQSQPQPQPQPQQRPRREPTQAEALAGHIFNFVTSASELSSSLSNPIPAPSSQVSAENGQSKPKANGVSGYGNGTPPRGDDDGDGESGKDANREEDEVKLLRLRTKKHEIVVVPDRRYLLCVVHNATPGSSAGSSGSGMSGGWRSPR